MNRIYFIYAAILFGLSGMFLYAAPACAKNKHPDSAYQFSPRIEVKARTSRARTLTATEIWSPLAQKNDRILYGSLRYMGDNHQNFEGNIGIGYRQTAFSGKGFIPQQILGAHAWLDRRHTTNNFTFYQAVIGAEIMGDTHDLRANLYLPLSGARFFQTPNAGSEKPYLMGYGIYRDTHGFAVEEAQSGFDVEIGHRLPFFEKHIDSIRVYNGFYRFTGKETDSVVGIRSRFDINITPSFTVGARAQYDHIRGTQGMAEVTIRFPFTSKKPYSSKDLRSRLDESPERDIDIITNARLIDDGLMKPVLPPDGQEIQRIIHVDNRFSDLGTGTAENPYHSILSIQDNMRPNDIIYIHHGDASSYHLDQGLVISQPGVQLIGSGVHLVHQNGRIFPVAANQIVQGDVLIQATQRPTIKNQSVTNGFGNALTITASDIYVTGMDFSNAHANGIAIIGDGREVKNILIDRVSASDNDVNGISIEALNGGSVQNITIQDSLFNFNINSGVRMTISDQSSQISNIRLVNSTGYENRISGMDIHANNGTINNISIENNNFHENIQSGITMDLAGQSYASVSLDNNHITHNTTQGIALITNDMASVHLKAQGNLVTGTGQSDPYISSFGLYIDRDSMHPDFQVDFGGGLLGSMGGNRIYNNGSYEIFLDTRRGNDSVSYQGDAVNARYNYWGGGSLNLARILYDHNIGQGHYSFINTSPYANY